MTLVDLVHRALTPVFDLVCRPFLGLSPIWAMTAISLAAGVGMVWLFGRVSDQPAITRLREAIRGNLIGVRLFQHDVGVVLRLQRRILGDTLRYMRLALVPMLILFVPVLLIMTQLNLRFAVRPVQPGEAAIVKAFVRDAARLGEGVALETGRGLTVETPGVRIPATGEVAWRVRANEAGRHDVVVRVGEASLDTRLIVDEQWGAVPQRRTGRGVLDALLYPGEPPIPAAHAVEAIEVEYPPLELSVLGWTVHWLAAFFVISLACGFAVKGRLGVEV